jgi:chemotaxis protein histidine kinase CheA
MTWNEINLDSVNDTDDVSVVLATEEEETNEEEQETIEEDVEQEEEGAETGSGEEEDESEDEESETEEEDSEETPTKTAKPSRSQKRIRQLVEEKKRIEAEKAAEIEALKAELSKATETANTYQKNSASRQKELLTSRVEDLKKLAKDALDEGDTEAYVEAQEKLNNASFELRAIDAYVAEEGEDSSTTKQGQPQQPTSPGLYLETQNWIENNDWFGIDPTAHRTAIMINNKLEKEGYDPQSTEFYKELDKRLDKIMPNRQDYDFTVGKSSTKTEAKKSKKAKPTVSPGTSRVPAKKTKNSVRLSASQVEMAHRMGLTPKQYAKELKRIEENQDHLGYTELDI